MQYRFAVNFRILTTQYHVEICMQLTQILSDTCLLNMNKNSWEERKLMKLCEEKGWFRPGLQVRVEIDQIWNYTSEKFCSKSKIPKTQDQVQSSGKYRFASWSYLYPDPSKWSIIHFHIIKSQFHFVWFCIFNTWVVPELNEN